MRAGLLLPWLCLFAHAAFAGSPPASCVDVAVNEHPVLAYDCLSRRLAPAASQVAPPLPDPAAVAALPPNQQVGQYDFSALKLRMGNRLGTSVYPQRPPPPAPPPPRVAVPGGR